MTRNSHDGRQKSCWAAIWVWMQIDWTDTLNTEAVFKDFLYSWWNVTFLTRPVQLKLSILSNITVVKYIVIIHTFQVTQLSSWSQSWEPLLFVFVWVLTGVFQCVPTFFWRADFRVGVHLQAKPPSVCLSPLSVCFSAISVFLLLPLLQSFIYIPKPHPYRAAQLLPLKMYLA